jgi:hypothetical protein
MKDFESRESAHYDFEKEFPGRLQKGIQYQNSEFDHGMLRLWPDGRLCISRINKRKDAWVFVRLATEEDIERVKKMLSAGKKAEELFGESK